MAQPKNYREVGSFDVLDAPLNPIGAFNAEQFKVEVGQMINDGCHNVVIDLGELDFLYSDAFNAFMMVQAELASLKGSLGVITSVDQVIQTLRQAGVDQVVKIYPNEAQLLASSSGGNSSSTASKAKAESPNFVSNEDPSPFSAKSSLKDTYEAPEPEESVSEREQKLASVRRESALPGASPNPHQFIQSFNSSLNTDDPFDDGDTEDSLTDSGSSMGLAVFLVLLLVGGGVAAWYFFLR